MFGLSGVRVRICQNPSSRLPLFDNQPMHAPPMRWANNATTLSILASAMAATRTLALSTRAYRGAGAAALTSGGMIVHRRPPSATARGKGSSLCPTPSDNVPPRPGARWFAATSDADDGGETIHRKYYSMTGVGRRSLVEMTTDTAHVLRTDVPRRMGGTDAAPQPVEHLLAALIGCAQATAVFVGRRMQPRLVVDEIEFDLRAWRDERGALAMPIDELPPVPARLQAVEGTAKVRFNRGRNGYGGISEDQMRLLGEQVEARCPVANMMQASGCKMDIKWANWEEA